MLIHARSQQTDTIITIYMIIIHVKQLMMLVSPVRQLHLHGVRTAVGRLKKVDGNLNDSILEEADVCSCIVTLLEC